MPAESGSRPEEETWTVIAAIVSLRHADGDSGSAAARCALKVAAAAQQRRPHHFISRRLATRARRAGA